MFIAQGGVLNLSVDEFGQVVGGDILKKLLRAAAADLDFPHVRHIKQSRCGSDRLVFSDHTAVLHRHLPATKINHPCFELPVHSIQGSFFHPYPPEVDSRFLSIRPGSKVADKVSILMNFILFSKSPEHLYIFSLLINKKGSSVPELHQVQV